MNPEYRAVGCQACGWRGKRSYTTNWFGCPRGCGATIIATDGSAEADILNERNRLRREEFKRDMDAIRRMAARGDRLTQFERAILSIEKYR